jgi:hypothetical protein
MSNQANPLLLPVELVSLFNQSSETTIRFTWKLDDSTLLSEGNLFWVQEKFCAHWGAPAPGGVVSFGFSVPQSDGSTVVASEHDPLHVYYYVDNSTEPFPHIEWQSAETMQRWASRMTLQLKHVTSEEGGFNCVFDVIKSPIRELAPLPTDAVQ